MFREALNARPSKSNDEKAAVTDHEGFIFGYLELILQSNALKCWPNATRSLMPTQMQ